MRNNRAATREERQVFQEAAKTGYFLTTDYFERPDGVGVCAELHLQFRLNGHVKVNKLLEVIELTGDRIVDMAKVNRSQRFWQAFADFVNTGGSIEEVGYHVTSLGAFINHAEFSDDFPLPDRLEPMEGFKYVGTFDHDEPDDEYYLCEDPLELVVINRRIGYGERHEQNDLREALRDINLDDPDMNTGEVRLINESNGGEAS